MTGLQEANKPEGNTRRGAQGHTGRSGVKRRRRKQSGSRGKEDQRHGKDHRMAVGFQFTTGAFKGKEADPETTRERLDRYLENIERLFVLNRRINPQSGLTVEFTNEEKKNILCVEGGTEMQELFKHEGKVQDDDTYEDAVRKIKEALKKRENRSAGVYRLFTALP